MNTDGQTVKAESRLHDVADILKTLSEWCSLEASRVSAVDGLCNRLQKENEDLRVKLNLANEGDRKFGELEIEPPATSEDSIDVVLYEDINGALFIFSDDAHASNGGPSETDKIIATWKLKVEPST